MGHGKKQNQTKKSKEPATLANNAINERNFQFAKQLSHKTEECVQQGDGE